MTTDFSQIIFRREDHSYTYNGRELQSVTQKIKELQRPFDREGAARRVADREGRTVESVLAQWDDNYRISTARGNQVHEHIKKVLTGGNGPVDDPLMVVDNPLPEIDAFNNYWQSIMDQVLVHPAFVEWVVGDEEMWIAGTLDALIFSYEDNLWHLFDWKSGKFDTSNRFDNLLRPFDDLDACQWVTYSLQVSLYRLIVERNIHTMTLGDSYLVHLGSDGRFTVHKAIDLRARLFSWLDLAITD